MWLNELISNIAFVFWLFLPAGIANMIPVFLSKIPILRQWNTPLDFGLSWRGVRILGVNKTIRGLIGGAFLGGVICYLQSLIFLPATQINPFVFGVLLGTGALLGDAIKSFFKRQLRVSPGSSWFPFDQIDYILGAILITLPFIDLSATQYILAILIWFILHLLTVVIGYLLHIRKDII